MAHFQDQSEPFVFDFKKLLMLSDKEAVAQSEVDVKMVYPISGGITVSCQCFLHGFILVWVFVTILMLFGWLCSYYNKCCLWMMLFW